MAMHILGLRLERSTLRMAPTHRRRTLWLLSRLQLASAAALGAFSVVHLSAPVMSLMHVSGDVNERVDAVSRWMLLGRVAYQSGVGEVLLYASLATHLVSGLLKRLVTRFTVAQTSSSIEDTKDVKDQVPSRRGNRLNTAHLSGYILAPFAIHHALVNRIIPSRPSAPISALSPSELDYSLVSHSLSHSNTAVRVLMGAAYTGLIGAFAVHAVYAAPTLLRALPPTSASNARKNRRSSQRQVQVSASLAVLLLTSLVAIVPIKSGDTLMISTALKQRYDAVLRFIIPTRFFL